MNTALQKIINETLTFKLVSHGVYESDAALETGWVLPSTDVLAYIETGKGSVEFRESGDSFSVNQGKSMLSPGGLVRRNHFSTTSGRLVIHWVHVRFQIINNYNLLNLFETPKVFSKTSSEQLGVLIKNLISLASTKANNRSISGLSREKALGFELLSLISEECCLKKNALSLLNEYRNQADIIDYINNHLNRKITVTELAKRCSLSVSRFHRVFKKTTGRSPTEFITERRVNKAQTLLATTEMSLSEIADATGFANVYYFGRIFKQYSGSTPAAYRKQLLNQMIL